jgi:hypothetical protein
MSVMGEHAGEGIDAIFKRKGADIGKVGRTFWLIKSPKARPEQVQEMCRVAPSFVIFVHPATKGGARPTTTDLAAGEYSADGKSWHRLPQGLGPVTGRLDRGASALVFDKIETALSGTVDLWGYRDLAVPPRPLKFMLGCSTVCAVREDMTAYTGRMKSRYRQVVAVARLVEPYGVWLR